MVEMCGICRDDLEDNVKTLDCAHAFHAECIDSWTVRVPHCPFCRAPVAHHFTEHELEYSTSEEAAVIEHIAANSISLADIAVLVDTGALSQQGLLRVVDQYCTSIDALSLIMSGYVASSGIVWLVYTEKLTSDGVAALLDTGFLTIDVLVRIVSVYIDYFSKHNADVCITNVRECNSPEKYMHVKEIIKEVEGDDAIQVVFDIMDMIVAYPQ